jgi:hypothetical protein
VILPVGKPLYQNLSTSYTQFDEMLSDLRANRFTGYIKVSFWEYEGILIFDVGKLVSAVEETKEGKLVGPEAVQGILLKAKRKDGQIGVYNLPAETILVITSITKSEAIKKDLTTDSVSLNDILKQAEDESVTGYLEVNLKRDSGKGIVFLHDGIPVDSILTTDSGDIESGENIFPKIAKLVKEVGAGFNLYKGDPHATFEESSNVTAILELPHLLKVISEIIATIEQTIDKINGAGNFITTFKKVLNEKSSEYPFLDPFAGEFEYKNGVVSFIGRAQVSDFLEALSQSLVTTISRSIRRDAKVDCVAQVKNDLEKVRKKYTNEIEKFNLEEVMATIW